MLLCSLYYSFSCDIVKIGENSSHINLCNLESAAVSTLDHAKSSSELDQSSSSAGLVLNIFLAILPLILKLMNKQQVSLSFTQMPA